MALAPPESPLDWDASCLKISDDGQGLIRRGRSSKTRVKATPVLAVRRRAHPLAFFGPDHYGGIRRWRNRGRELSSFAGAYQLLLLNPVPGPLRERPRRTDSPIIVRSTDQGDAAISGHCHGR
jgi:hypothetical protein